MSFDFVTSHFIPIWGSITEENKTLGGKKMSTEYPQPKDYENSRKQKKTCNFQWFQERIWFCAIAKFSHVTYRTLQIFNLYGLGRIGYGYIDFF